jgi:hypothetical protein
MFKRFMLASVLASLALAAPSQAQCQPHSELSRVAGDLMDEIVIWLSSNFDLPSTNNRPEVAFVSKTKLATMRAGESAPSQDFTQEQVLDDPAERRIVALYDDKLETIFLSDDWAGQSPADQSVLVHEMVHHLQNVAKAKFECPTAREKLAYTAQGEWLVRRGTSLEKEFQIDMFTLLISSACMY